MMDTTDMSTPVTHGELREELAQLEMRLEQKLAHLMTKAEFEQRLAPLATKTELEIWGGALLVHIETRIESGERRMIERIECSEQRLLTELARHTKAIEESMSTRISVIDEKYADLPARVGRLETAVFRQNGGERRPC